MDIVGRLRHPPFGTETSERNLMNQAADEIERLREALQKILDIETHYEPYDCIDIARAALKESE